jgi:hypothetical protein
MQHLRYLRHALLHGLHVRLLQGRLLTMNEKAARIAIGGVFSALCLLFMFMTAVIPFASFAMPMLAGAALTVVTIENSAKTAFLVYVTVSLLSIFIVPDLDAKLLFIVFFGYYSIIASGLGRIRAPLPRLCAKLFVFNAAMTVWYFGSTKLFGMDEALAESGFFYEYGLPIIFAGLNFTFLVYDFTLKRYAALYTHWFRPRFLKK